MKDLHERVREALEGRSICHDYQHALHVKRIALDVAWSYNHVDKDELIATALLHDVWDHKFVTDPAEVIHTFKDHLYHEGFSEDAIQRIYCNIESLSWSKGQTPIYVEGRIVQDADRITALGAIGILRAATYQAKNNQAFEVTIQHLIDKCLLLKDSLNLSESRIIAADRHDFLVQFIEQYKREIQYDTSYPEETPCSL